MPLVGESHVSNCAEEYQYMHIMGVAKRMLSNPDSYY